MNENTGVKTVDAEQLIMRLNLNIPSMSKQYVEFTRDIIYQPNSNAEPENMFVLEKYPFITSAVKYPVSELSKLEYPERIKFFFNEDRFVELLSQQSENVPETDRAATLESNILIMLDLLFPTSFPVVSNLSMSKDTIDGNTTTLPTSSGAGIFRSNSSSVYSYLRINGKVYTIQKIVWLNDLMNHPVYYPLVSYYRKYKQFGSAENSQIKRVYNNLLRELRTNRLSTNTAFQTAVNQTTDPSGITGLLEYAIGRYLDGTADRNADLQPLLDVGVSMLINANPDKPGKEIYLMLDLIDKELNSQNESAMSCSYMDEYLGNQVKMLLDNMNKVSTTSWNVMKNRYLFNSTASIGSNNMAGSTDNIVPNFDTYILQNNSEITSKYETLSSVYQFKEPTIIEFLKNNVGYATEVYNHLTKWNKSLESKSIVLISNIQKTMVGIEDKMKNLNISYVNEVDAVKKDKLKRDMEIHILYLLILDGILKHENKKPVIFGGYLTRRKKKRRCYTAKKKRSYRKK